MFFDSRNLHQQFQYYKNFVTSNMFILTSANESNRVICKSDFAEMSPGSLVSVNISREESQFILQNYFFLSLR